MNITKEDCLKTQAKIIDTTKKERNVMFSNLQKYMEEKMDKFDTKLEKHEDKQELQFKELHIKIDAFANTKVDKGMFKWIVGVIIVGMFSIAGLLLAQSVDLGVIKTVLEIAEVT